MGLTFLQKRKWWRIKAHWNHRRFRDLVRYLVTGHDTWFSKFTFPSIMKMGPSLLASDLVNVQPMADIPDGTVFYMKLVNKVDRKDGEPIMIWRDRYARSFMAKSKPGDPPPPEV